MLNIPKSRIIFTRFVSVSPWNILLRLSHASVRTQTQNKTQLAIFVECIFWRGGVRRGVSLHHPFKAGLLRPKLLYSPHRAQVQSWEADTRSITCRKMSSCSTVSSVKFANSIRMISSCWQTRIRSQIFLVQVSYGSCQARVAHRIGPRKFSASSNNATTVVGRGEFGAAT